MGWAITTAWQRIAALPQPPDQHEPRPSDPATQEGNPGGSKEPPTTPARLPGCCNAQTLNPDQLRGAAIVSCQ